MLWMTKGDRISYTIRVDKTLFCKFKVIVKKEKRSMNQAIGHLMILRIHEFEQEHGKIEEYGRNRRRYHETK